MLPFFSIMVGVVAATHFERNFASAAVAARVERDDAQHRRHPLKVCGPASIQTLRGRLLGREVALICCGEEHMDTIDLTRSGGMTEPEFEWVEDSEPARSSGFHPEDAVASQVGLSAEAAKIWATSTLDDAPGGFLVFEPASPLRAAPLPVSRARVFPPSAGRSSAHQLATGARVFHWSDMDKEAREFNGRRLAGEIIPSDEQDALIARRKQKRLNEDGIELFDEWLIRQAVAGAEIILEAPVDPLELEMHVEAGVDGPPLPHECLRRLELDSDSDDDGEANPDDGTGSFLDYLHRRFAQSSVPPARVHRIDPRELGDAHNEDLRAGYQALQGRGDVSKSDAESMELQALGLSAELGAQRKQAAKASRERDLRRSWVATPPLPSWEAFFGAAAEILYYSPHVQADYTPFLTRCVGDADVLRRFMQALFFKTVPDALSEIQLDATTRPFACIRSLSFQPPVSEHVGVSHLQQRPSCRGSVPVRAAPVDRFLKARGSNPPRTWVSGLAERLTIAGAGNVVAAAQEWLVTSVDQLLSNPKGDPDGDWFKVWLRECHREIHDDIDTCDAERLRKRQWAPRMRHHGASSKRHNLRPVRIPDPEAAFEELRSFDPVSGALATRRQRVLSKILVDAWQLTSVDLAAALKVVQAALAAPEGGRAVVIFYAGEAHTRSAVNFWRTQGFGHVGLPQRGLVGGDGFEATEGKPCLHALPKYLCDTSGLFPLPASVSRKRIPTPCRSGSDRITSAALPPPHTPPRRRLKRKGSGESSAPPLKQRCVDASGRRRLSRKGSQETQVLTPKQLCAEASLVL